jgi:phosphatidylglycerophosphate synthase
MGQRSRRQATLDGADSRAASNALLDGLRAEGFGPKALGRFVYDATRRSILQARMRPVALAEATAVHAAMAALAHPRGRAWVLTSWLMTVTHLGMLEERRTMGLPNLLTIARANLPAAEHRLGTAVPVLALVTDFVDGKVARGTGTVTRFGTQGDYLSDAALWTWFVLKHERSRGWQIATFAAWAVPVAGLTVASFARGGMVDLPRSRWFRPAAAVEVLIGARVIARWWSGRSPRKH